ncbi:hypothetical protein BCR33DRAFT_717722 [Rhizoclosmatium globosum]|uniref:Uncharacterized protein n=1 Tax=Rhizoclosmatium globosum TaxID=329046 RepID=A0A1Y2C7X8_9FUNG|nr:hypothetical protein BCR33DRAFT_717722 [Rhizoclosmatium globosum]|eukprot:ORY42997.1 hypothetical protein BCR33DRAFT_717722 [Rhizoclosmatium globosum]
MRNRRRHAGILKFGESWAFQYCFSVQKITPRIVRMTISQSAVALNINPSEGARLTQFIQDESSDRIQQGTTNQGEPVSTTTIICITIAFAFILLLGGLCYWFCDRDTGSAVAKHVRLSMSDVTVPST